MEKKEALFLIINLLGGLALFIYGMRTMSQGLFAAAGGRIRTILARATRNHISGIGMGSTISFLIQSSASTVLFIGFIHAGLMTFGQSIAPMIGANVGTTLSIQLISFKLADYCLVGVFVGLILHVTGKQRKIKFIGLALLGFGLLILGMSTMSEAIRPHRELFEPWMEHINGSTTSGLLIGTLSAMLITGIIQSSGAVIGMGFALVSAGAITDIQGIYPIIIGANIGTCVTGLLGSIGTIIEARRIAIAHLIFNIISAAIGIATAPLFYRYIHLTAEDLIHQAANANTIKMLLSALLVVPLIPLFEKFVVFITPTKTEQPEQSFLSDKLCPEEAIFACLHELKRTSRICEKNLRLTGEEFLQHDSHRTRLIKINEESVDAIKSAMHDYLTNLTLLHRLSRRQTILVGYLDGCISNLERISDHIENLSDITKQRCSIPSAHFDAEMTEDWLSVHRATEKMLAKLTDSLDPGIADFQDLSKEVLELRANYLKTAIAARNAHYQRIEEKTITASSGMIFHASLSCFWRISKHIKNIALEEQQPQFRIHSDTPTFSGSESDR